MNFVQRGFVALPDKVKAGIVAVVVWVAAVLFANLLALIPFLSFLEPYIQPAALALAGLLVAKIEEWLPTGYDEIAIKAIELILLVLAVFGVGAELTAQGALPALLGF